MSLLGRPKAKTHRGMDMAAVMKMAGEVEELATDGQVSALALEDAAADLGVPLAKLYVGLGMTPALSMRIEHKLQVIVCTGGCQEYGALPCLNRLLELRQERLDDDTVAFDVVPRPCLNRCQAAPAVELRSVDGAALLADATPESLAEAVGELLGN